MSKQSFSEFYDRIPYIILKAPNHFPNDYDMDLEKAFSRLNSDLIDSKEELGDHFEKINILVEQSLQYYRDDDIRNGIKSLQAVDNIIKTKGVRAL